MLVLTLAASACRDESANGFENADRLLTDPELMLAVDTAVPKEPVWVAEWVKRSHEPLRSLTATSDFSDLEFLGPLLADVRVVLLGESSHGVREFNQLKVRLVRFLHERLGFDVIIFESGLLECFLADQAVTRAPAVEVMRLCVAPVWHTREVASLFEYIKDTRNTSRPLRLAGMDIQPSSFSANRVRPYWMAEVVAMVDSAYARDVFQIDSAFAQLLLGLEGPLVEFAREESWAPRYYAELSRFLASRGEADTASLLVARQAARATAQFLRQLAHDDDVRAQALRDSAMADNVRFLLDELFPNRKLIIWAHNTHIAKNVREMVHVATGRPAWITGMGDLLARERRDEIYSIGLYMARGRIADNTRREVHVAEPVSGSLESILLQSGRKYSFLHLRGIRRDSSTEWAFRSISARHAGRHTFNIVVSEQYDAVILIDSVTPPAYCTVAPIC
ncbi:MAG TPA: erythromycin esterase family protein [Longimicrobiales bacterium]